MSVSWVLNEIWSLEEEFSHYALTVQNHVVLSVSLMLYLPEELGKDFLAEQKERLEFVLQLESLSKKLSDEPKLIGFFMAIRIYKKFYVMISMQ